MHQLTNKQKEVLAQLDDWKRQYDLGRTTEAGGIGATLTILMQRGLLERRPCNKSSWIGNRINYEYKRVSPQDRTP